jgi:hypothetical protein
MRKVLNTVRSYRVKDLPEVHPMGRREIVSVTRWENGWVYYFYVNAGHNEIFSQREDVFRLNTDEIT